VTSKNFLGIPIDGDITSAKRTPQRPHEEFEPLVRALLEDPYIVEFGWHQYTPYFNDGDPCVFGASSVWVRTQDDISQPDSSDDENWEEEDDTERLALWSTHPSLGSEEGWGDDRRYVGGQERLWRAAKALSSGVESGAFDDVLLSLFGDHARVTVHKDRVVVDEYSHD
jgi:hypothetical protein